MCPSLLRPAQVEKLLSSSAASDSHDVCKLRGPADREIHHFWAEGLAIHMHDGLVTSVEAFGDDHSYHRRLRGAQLHPGVCFGSPWAEVEKALGAARARHRAVPPPAPSALRALSATSTPRDRCVRAVGSGAALARSRRSTDQ